MDRPLQDVEVIIWLLEMVEKQKPFGGAAIQGIESGYLVVKDGNGEDWLVSLSLQVR